MTFLVHYPKFGMRERITVAELRREAYPSLTEVKAEHARMEEEIAAGAPPLYRPPTSARKPPQASIDTARKAYQRLKEKRKA